MSESTAGDKRLACAWTSTYGLLVALGLLPWAPLAPLREATGEVVAKRINEHAGRDIP